jgi:hypothetical protein
MDQTDAVEGLSASLTMIHPDDIEWDGDEGREGSSSPAAGNRSQNYGQIMSYSTHNRSIGLSFLGLRSTVTRSGASPQLYHPIVLDPISSYSGLNVCLYYLYSSNTLIIQLLVC